MSWNGKVKTVTEWKLDPRRLWTEQLNLVCGEKKDLFKGKD